MSETQASWEEHDACIHHDADSDAMQSDSHMETNQQESARRVERGKKIDHLAVIAEEDPATEHTVNAAIVPHQNNHDMVDHGGQYQTISMP